jgi:hypothetical protein
MTSEVFANPRMPPVGQGDMRSPGGQGNARSPLGEGGMRPPVAITSPIASGLLNTPSRRHRRTTSPSPVLGRTNSPSPVQRRAEVTINMAHEVAAMMPSTRISDLGADSIVLPRSRPTITAPRDPYARNNDFLARMASAERLENELGRLQRPTPPPAVGHGRPGSGSNQTAAVVHVRSRPRAVPRWQRDQENSEEAAMSSMQEDVRSMYVHQEREAVENDCGVMDNTPPKETRLDRYLRG